MKFFKETKGTAIVEFAIVLPLLLALLFGIIEFGILFYNKAVITNASREGARAGIEASEPRLLDTDNSSTDPCASPATIDKIARCYCLNNLVGLTAGNPAPTTTVSGYASNATLGQELTVTVEYDYQFRFVPSFIPGIGNGITLRGETIMRYE